LKAFPDLLDKAVDAGIAEMGKQAIADVKSSYLQNVKGATVGDYVYASLDGYQTFIKDGKLPWVSAGSFNYVAGIGDIRASFGKTNKEMNPAQISYWLENGTMRLVSGAAKPKRVPWSEIDAVDKRVAIQATTFISKAAINGWNAQESAFAEGFNKIL
ncbi:MAG: hypothetical protein ACRDA8_11400, partial [Shewanella sp.]